jgi:DNA-binding transcriptional ArsR family regulator
VRLDEWSGFTDNTGMADNSRDQPDYELDDAVQLTRPDQLKALGDPLRFTLLGLLSERAATTSQLADALDRPRGTIGHHLKVLEAAGLVRVVRTRKVRAMTEKYYGRVARLSLLPEPGGAVDAAVWDLPLRQAAAELRDAPASAPAPCVAIRHARLSPARVAELAERLDALGEEIDDRVDPSAPVYGLVTALYETSWPQLPDDAVAPAPARAKKAAARRPRTRREP